MDKGLGSPLAISEGMGRLCQGEGGVGEVGAVAVAGRGAGVGAGTAVVGVAPVAGGRLAERGVVTDTRGELRAAGAGRGVPAGVVAMITGGIAIGADHAAHTDGICIPRSSN
jgi:hypothetical protein